MTLYVIPVPNPATGHDWVTTVPGQYIYDIVGISALLTSVGPWSGTMTDSSGNGNNGSYNLFGSPSPLGTGLIPGANAATWTYFTGPGPSRYGELDTGIDLGQPFSFDEWIKVNPAASLAPGFAMAFADVLAQADFYVAADGTIAFRWGDGLHFYTATTAAGVYPFDGSAHHLGMSYDGTHAKIYLDGVAQTLVETGLPSTAVDSVCVVYLGGGDSVGATGGASQYGQPAFYQSVLSPARFAAHAAASGSLTAYSASVLADSPTNYYKLDDLGPAVGRQVTLDVRDGTRTVLEVPTGFADATGVGPYQYNWQANLNSSTQTPAGTLTTVAIPPLVLPAGYTIGTRTLDLGTADQWSAINVWWSSDVMDALNFVDNYVYPPGVRLVYQRQAV